MAVYVMAEEKGDWVIAGLLLKIEYIYRANAALKSYPPKGEEGIARGINKGQEPLCRPADLPGRRADSICRRIGDRLRLHT
jgi:hypothetical protein